MTAGEVVADHTKVVKSNVRELRTAGTVSHRPDIGGRRLELFVNLHETSVISLDTGQLQADAVCVWRATARDQQMSTLYDDLGPVTCCV